MTPKIMSEHHDRRQTKQDAIVAMDLQLAYELQAQEEKKAKRRQNRKGGTNMSTLNADYMLFVSCILDGRQMQLLVDTGASSSAMSLDMVHRLGLTSKLNHTIYGNAKGVGSSNIVGVVENVELLIGHVEFRLFFMVIDSPLPCCILGLDQMRRFKCQVDLDDNVLVFGGKGGVSVPFLPKDEAALVAEQMIAASDIASPIKVVDPINVAANIGTGTSTNTEQSVAFGDKIKAFFKFQKF